MSGLGSTFSLASESPIEHIGTTRQATTTTSTWTVPVPSEVRAGDFILVSVSSASLITLGITSPSFTTMHTLSSNGTYDVFLRHFWRISDGTETTVSIGGPNTNGAIATCSVFRGVDNTNPFDVPTATSTSLYYYTFAQVNMPDIYPVTEGALVIKDLYLAYNGTSVAAYMDASDSPQIETLNRYYYSGGNVNLTHLIATSSFNDTLKNYTSQYYEDAGNYSYGTCAAAIALRPAYS